MKLRVSFWRKLVFEYNMITGISNEVYKQSFFLCKYYISR